jgi:recombination protein RecA
MEENADTTATIEQLVRQKLTEGSEVTANSMRPLAAAARPAADKDGARGSSGSKQSDLAA